MNAGIQIYRCLIVDDEPIALDILETFVKKTPGLFLVDRCRNVKEAMKVMKAEKINLLFLDIEMPEITGMDFLAMNMQRPAVILTTAYRDYAVESYEYAVIDYLVKPIAYERFLKAVEKFKTSKPLKIQNGVFTFMERQAHLQIPLHEILYIAGAGDYISIHTHGKKYLVYQTMQAFEQKYAAHGFIRIHKSYIVNICNIKSRTVGEVKTGEQRIPIGRAYREKVKEQLGLL